MVSRHLILTLILALAVSPLAYGQDRTRDLNSTVPADQIRSVVIDANVGKVELRGTSDNTARIAVHIKAKSTFSIWSGREWGDPDGVDLRTEVRGSELRITLRGERKNLQEEWVITVPSRVEAKVNANVGSVDVYGITGGCDAEVNVGELKIDVPEGDIRAVTNVGEVKIRTATKSFASVNVDASVGDTRLMIDGNRIRSKRGYGPGSRASADGPGKDRIRVSASVGDAEVTVR